MITVIAKLPVKEGKMDEAMAAFQVLISKVASEEEGTVLYSLNRDKANPDVLVVVEQYRDKADPNTLVVVEQYQDKAALEFHSSTPHFKEFFEASTAFIGGRPEMSVMKEIQRAKP
ncbi:MAG: putative quinol monooxygenase [Smithellaceae bacterium]